MRRRSWLMGVCLAAVVAAGGLIANAAVAANAAPVPAACPTRQPAAPGYSGLLISQLRLVPFTPEHALLCRYNGMNGSAGSPAWDLTGTARLDGAKAAQLAASTNAAAHLPNLGVVNCPMDDSSGMDVYFWDSPHHIRVRFWTSGCETASNGGVISPSISQSNIVPELEQLTPGKEPGTIRGTILQIGGPVAADGTQPTPRPVIGIVAIYQRSRSQLMVSRSPFREVRTAPDGTFSCTIESGKYFVVAESLDGSQIVQPQSITLESAESLTVILRVDVP